MSLQKKVTATRSIIFYDAQCPICTYWVQWIHTKDPHQIFTCAAIGSTLFFERLQKDEQIQSSITLLHQNTVLTGFLALKEIFHRIPNNYRGHWKFRIIFALPPFLGNIGYRWIAKHRYKLSKFWKVFGRHSRDIKKKITSNSPDGGIGRHASLRDLYQ